MSSLAACPEIVAARREGDGWDIHVVRHGRLASTGVAGPYDVPQAVARSTVATAETVRPAPAPLPAATSRRPSGSRTGSSSRASG